MKNQNPYIRRTSAAAFCILLVLLSAHRAFSQPKTEDSVVKIVTTYQEPDFYSPWQMKQIGSQSGTGFIIQGERIMTNAHVVANAKYIIVQKNNDPNEYTAYLEHVGHDCDLAILKVNDPAFFSGTTPLEFAPLPRINDTVYAYGYPVGGEKVSVTKGIVSRIDYIRYSHSGVDYHLAIQVDAAVNPGNSGGPIIMDGKVAGVAFQSLMWAENSSYMIPFPVVERFLRDISDGTYDGYIELGFYYQETVNPAIRERYGLAAGQSGVLVTELFMAGAEKVLRKDDILISIDGFDIATDGTIVIWDERLPLTEAAEIKLPGEAIPVTFIRDGQKMTETLALERFTPPMDFANSYDTEPEYLIVGGLVFVPLSREFLKTWGENWYNTANKKLLYDFFFYVTDGIYRTWPSMVVLSRRLPDPVNTYCENYEDLLVSTVNGQKVCTLKDMKDMIRGAKSPFVVIEFQSDVSPIVLKADAVSEADARIMERYSISRLENLEETE